VFGCAKPNQEGTKKQSGACGVCVAQRMEGSSAQFAGCAPVQTMRLRVGEQEEKAGTARLRGPPACARAGGARANRCLHGDD